MRLERRGGGVEDEDEGGGEEDEPEASFGATGADQEGTAERAPVNVESLGCSGGVDERTAGWMFGITHPKGAPKS